MKIDSIQNGVVIDHISAGCGVKLYELLGLDTIDCSVALIRNVASKKMGRKDIIKIDAAIPVNLDVIGYVDPDATVNVIRDGELVEKKSIPMPEQLVNEWIRPDTKPEELLPCALTEMMFERAADPAV